MLIHCHSNRCNTTRDHKLKIDTNEVLCMECGEINTLMSDIIKKAMKSSGDIYRTVQKRSAFMYKCSKCTVERGAKIVNDQAVCETCHTSLNLAAPTIQAIKAMNGAAREDVIEESNTKRPAIKRSKKAVDE